MIKSGRLWPKGIRPKDWRGIYVRSLCELRTKGGCRFPAGTVFLVSKMHAGRANLNKVGPDGAELHGEGCWIRRVHHLDLELTPKPGRHA